MVGESEARVYVEALQDLFFLFLSLVGGGAREVVRVKERGRERRREKKQVERTKKGERRDQREKGGEKISFFLRCLSRANSSESITHLGVSARCS